MIQLEHVTKSFGDKTAVSDINLTVQEGENVILIGTSGCGKTTTLRMINRLIEPDSGRVMINGQDAKRQSPHELRRGIGYVLQQHGLFPHYTVAENIAVVPRLLGWDAMRIRSRSEELLQKLHLDPSIYLNVYPTQLSGGQQQRVGLARALIADAPIVLMDEPFGALDDVTRKSIRKDFMQLEEFKRKTIVLVTHDIGEAFELGNRICIMDKGRIVQQGSRQNLLFDPADDFVKDFLSSHLLELQLRMTSLGDLLPFLEQSAPAFDRSRNVWEMLEEMIVRPVNNDSAFSPASLMQAFQQFNTRRNGRSTTGTV
jgi:osmoprotectant transport system ATP-binding protein